MNKLLGQHFLKNKEIIKKIIAALNIKSGETVIEIGPGKGALTFPLLEECSQKKCDLIAIEKDKLLVKSLKLKVSGNEDPKNNVSNIEIIEGDILKVLPEIIENLKLTNLQTYKLVGNIPYYITGKLLRIISELKNKPALSVLMVQKEVAERITASPPKNNLLAAATQYWANPEIILRLKAKEFDPAPEVDSAVIRLTTLRLGSGQANDKRQTTQKEPADASAVVKTMADKKAMASEAEKYYKLIHIIFKQPRKTLVNNLKDGLNVSRGEIEKVLNSLDLPLNCRPQDLSIKQIINLSQIYIKS